MNSALETIPAVSILADCGQLLTQGSIGQAVNNVVSGKETFLQDLIAVFQG
jgi:hypothetical protein